jgi:hypothetical protein
MLFSNDVSQSLASCSVDDAFRHVRMLGHDPCVSDLPEAESESNVIQL